MNNVVLRSTADSEEVATLIASLHATERRIEELTAGEVDSVTDSEGHPFLLRRAQEGMRANDAGKDRKSVV